MVSQNFEIYIYIVNGELIIQRKYVLKSAEMAKRTYELAEHDVYVPKTVKPTYMIDPPLRSINLSL